MTCGLGRSFSALKPTASIHNTSLKRADEGVGVPGWGLGCRRLDVDSLGIFSWFWGPR